MSISKSTFIKDETKEYKHEIEKTKSVLDLVCDQVEIGVYRCYDDTCNKVYYAANKADCYFTLDGDRLSMDGFTICCHCEKGYCDEHYKLLIPSIDNKDMKKYSLCGYVNDFDE